METTLASATAQTLAAATATTVFDAQLAGYSKVTLALKNPGANDVTAVTWEEGAGDILADNTTVAAQVLDTLDAGESAVIVLTGNDIPSRLRVKLTSSSGTTYDISVKGERPDADLIPS